MSTDPNLYFEEENIGLCTLSAVVCPYESPEYVQNYIRHQFDLAGLDGKHAAKVSWLESRYDPSAISKTNDFGYFQFNKRWHPNGVECFGKPDQLECEVKYAIELVKKSGWNQWTTNKLIK